MIAEMLAGIAANRNLGRKAELLSGRGWKFFRQEGPQGIYYTGRGPRCTRIQSEASQDEREALKNAIEQAFRYWNG